MFSGNLDRTKLLARIQSQFHLRGKVWNFIEYIRSCHVCQKLAEKRLGSIFICATRNSFSTSFSKIVIDIVGEINPASARGHRFLLYIITTCSSWAEAVPLKYVTSEAVAEAMLGDFCRMGFPDVILSSKGTEFVSRTMRNFTAMLSIVGVTI